MAGLAYTLAAHPLEIAAILMQSDVPVKRVAMVARGAHKGAGGAVGVGSGAMRTVLEYKCVPLTRSLLFYVPLLTAHHTTSLSILYLPLLRPLLTAHQSTSLSLFSPFPWCDRYTQGMVQCLRAVWHGGSGPGPGGPATPSALAGLGELYRGAMPSVLRAVPSYAASFWGYEVRIRALCR